MVVARGLYLARHLFTLLRLSLSNTIILSGIWARLKLPINIAQEAEAACLDVGGYLAEPRSENREQHLEDIAEARNPETAFLQLIS